MHSCLENPVNSVIRQKDKIAQVQNRHSKKSLGKVLLVRADYQKQPTFLLISVQFSSVAQSCLTLRPHELQHTRPPCPSPTPRVYPNSRPLSQWCHPTISSSVVPFSSCPQSFPASGSFSMSQLFAWGGQSIGVSASASVLPMNTQDWSPSGFQVKLNFPVV